MNFVFDAFSLIFLFGLLAVFLAIGLYFGCISKNPKTMEDYLLGSRNLSSFPIAMSLLTSQVSVITLLTLPMEVYQFGLYAMWSDLSLYLVLPIISFIILPIFHENGIWNCFEYLEKRFDRKTRNLVTGAFIAKVYLMLPIFIFIPSLIFSQLTNINVHLINGIVSCVCVLYTMLGGVRAVIYTQVIQGFIILTTIAGVVMIVLARADFMDMLEVANDGGRLEAFNFKFDFTTRSTLWNTLIGGSFNWISLFAVQPITVQRIVSIRSMKTVRRSVILFALMCSGLTFLLYFMGIAMYSKYHSCDPLTAGQTNELVTFFVLDLTNSHFITGLYVACLFCSAMSVVSSNFNTVAAVLHSHFFTPKSDSIEYDSCGKQQKPLEQQQHQQTMYADERRANVIIRTMIIVSGCYSIVAAVLIEQFNWLIQIAITASGVTQCFLAGLFLFAILYPKATGDAVFRVTYFSILISALFQFGNLIQRVHGLLADDVLPISVANCTQYDSTIEGQLSMRVEQTTANGDGGMLFKTSFYWYSLIAAVAIWFYGMPYSKLMRYKQTPKKVDPKLMAYFVTKWIPESDLDNHYAANDREMEYLKKKISVF